MEIVKVSRFPPEDVDAVESMRIVLLIHEEDPRGVAPLTLRLVCQRFGEVDAGLEEGIRRLPLEELNQLNRVVLNLNGPEDLAAWFTQGRGGN